MVTGMPAERKFIEMPPPMVPAPMTPTRAIGFVATSGPMSAILAAARSAKNTCRCAFDWVEPSSAMNISRSFATPSSNGRSTAFLTDSIAFSHASKPRNLRAFALRIVSKIAGSPRAGASFSSRSRTFFNGALSAISRLAKAIAPSLSLPSSASASTTPQSFASRAPNGVPDRMTSSAVSTPTRRGRRWVPPAPGMRPSLISGRPHLAEGTAIR